MNDRTEYLNRDDWAVIANISDQEFHSDQAGLGLYTIPACAPGERCAVTTVYGRTELYDMGDDRKGERYWAARLIAKSVLAEHNPDADLRRYGVILCAGDVPLDAELADADARRVAFFREQVEQADALYARASNRPEMISDVQRRAARHLGLDRPWLVKIAPMQECPVCGDPVKVGVALCRHCGAVLDEGKAARFGVLRVPSRGRGIGDEAVSNTRDSFARGESEEALAGATSGGSRDLGNGAATLLKGHRI
ncbi:MAG TPA: zinc ribbon domain-containing protein [Candidatus Acidoferrales bacterium]|nr:zinc ribbon domain-containing protein [Candidatus Acidoferrales bacterium]